MALVSKKLLGRIALSSLSTLLALSVAELALRLFLPPIQVGPTFTTFSEELGFENKKNLDCRRLAAEYDTRVTTNEHGLRSPPLSLEKPPGTVRILCVGDSFTFGKGVEDDEPFCRLLEDRLNAQATEGAPRYQMLNAGVVSYGTANELRYLQPRGLRFEPDLVMLQLHSNDFIDNLGSTLFELDADGNLVEGEADPQLRSLVEAFDKLPFRSLLESSHLFNYVRLRMHITIPHSGNAGAPEGETRQERRSRSERLLQALLARFADTCEAATVPLLVVAVDLDEAQMRAVRGVLDPRGVPVVGLRWLESHPERYYPVDGHWKPEGHRAAAATLDPTLRALLDGGRLDSSAQVPTAGSAASDAALPWRAKARQQRRAPGPRDTNRITKHEFASATLDPMRLMS